MLALALACGNAAAGSLTTSVRTTAGAPVEDAAVVLEPAAGGPLANPRGRATIEQRDREFIPYLTIVQKGTAVDFPNRDPFKHHVYSFSPAKVFEIKLYAKKPAAPVVFDKAGEVVLGCNIHDWMAAYTLVVESPWFAKTDRNGMARIDRIPPGAYRLRLWHPRQTAAVAERPIKVGAEAQRLDLAIDIGPRPVVKKPPLDSDRY